MAKISASDYWMVGDAINTNAASNPVQKSVLTTAATSGLTGTARDAKSAELQRKQIQHFLHHLLILVKIIQIMYSTIHNQ